jgi:hypothetical protein
MVPHKGPSLSRVVSSAELIVSHVCRRGACGGNIGRPRHCGDGDERLGGRWILARQAAQAFSLRACYRPPCRLRTSHSSLPANFSECPRTSRLHDACFYVHRPAGLIPTAVQMCQAFFSPNDSREKPRKTTRMMVIPWVYGPAFRAVIRPQSAPSPHDFVH